MGTVDNNVYPTMENEEYKSRVAVPPPQPFFKSLQASLKETFFPDDPLRQFKNQPKSRKFILGLQYFFPFFVWAPNYRLDLLKSDLIAGITTASLAIPQGINSTFVPPLVYAMMGTSKDVAVGNIAVGSLLTGAMLSNAVSPSENATLFLHLAFTATLVAGIFEATLGLLRLGFIVDFLSHATIVGFMGGAATVVCLQQLKGILGLTHFTQATDLIDVMHSVFSQEHQWKWESAVLGCGFLFFLLTTKYLGKKKPILFWMSVMSPLVSIILGSVLVYLTHAEKHGVQVIGALKKGINPPSFEDFVFNSPYLGVAIKTGIVTGIIAMAEGMAVARSFAMFKNYNIDGNKEMVAFGVMNIIGSCTSCYLTSGPFSRSAVNYNAGCKTAASNIVMSMAVMITLLFLTPLFYYTPLVVLSSIIISAMLGLVDYDAVIHLWKSDKFDFVVCMTAYIGVVFGSVEIGLGAAISLSILRVLLFVARPRTTVLGNVPNSLCYRSVDQYPGAQTVPGILILEIGGPIYFANSTYLRERISRWIDEEEERLKASGEAKLHYVILDMRAVTCIDTSGIGMFDEVKKVIDRRELQLVLANPGGEVMKKLDRADFLNNLGLEWVHLTVGEAVGACRYMLHTYKPKSTADSNV
ncbi:Sulfate transporter 3.1 [Bienertia sinuspersici]